MCPAILRSSMHRFDATNARLTHLFPYPPHSCRCSPSFGALPPETLAKFPPGVSGRE